MRTEKGLAIMFLVGLVFRILHWPGAGFLLVISLGTLAILYFPVAFYFFSDKTLKKQNLALSIVSGFFLSIIPLGLLFKLQYWPGGQIYLLAGMVTAPIILAVTYFLKTKAVEKLTTYYKNMMLRTGTLTILTILLYLTPMATLLKIHYSDDPELARLKILHYTNLDNAKYRIQHDEYLMNRDSLYLEE